MDSVIQSVELIDSLRIKYKEYLKPNFTSIFLSSKTNIITKRFQVDNVNYYWQNAHYSL